MVNQSIYQNWNWFHYWKCVNFYALHKVQGDGYRYIKSCFGLFSSPFLVSSIFYANFLDWKATDKYNESIVQFSVFEKKKKNEEKVHHDKINRKQKADLFNRISETFNNNIDKKSLDFSETKNQNERERMRIKIRKRRS